MHTSLVVEQDEAVQESVSVDIHIENEDDIQSVHNKSKLRSKHAIAIQKIVGDCPDIIFFDNMYTMLKSLKRRATREEISSYEGILAKLQAMVIHIRRDVTIFIMKFEEEHYKQNGSLPSEDPKYMELCRKLKNIKTLLRNWKITI